MRTPPFLLGTTLLFWGWQTDYVTAGVLMAVALEATHLIKARWDFSEEDFSRIWMLCAVLFLAAFTYAFTFSQEIHGARLPYDRFNEVGGNISARTAATFIGWLPMVFYLFILAQTYNIRDTVPATAVSLIVRRRRRKARKSREAPPTVNVSYPYFMVCLLAASVQNNEPSRFYFWGLCVLLAWSLWPHRSRWFSPATWAVVLGLAVLGGYGGHRGIRQVQRLLAAYNPDFFSASTSGDVDPLQSRTQIGRVGRIKMSGRIVIRLEPKNGSRPPVYLRSASYRLFKPQSRSWSANYSREEFENVTRDTNSVWQLVPGKTGRFTNSIACYLNDVRQGVHFGVLPLPSGSAQLENLAAYTLQKNSLGATLAQGPGLLIFDACSGPGETADSSPDYADREDVPEAEQPALNAVIAEMNLTNREPDEVLRAVRLFFSDNFSYRTWEDQAEVTPLKATPLSMFLLKTRAGHCEYFATAAVLLLRQLGIPARYAVGFAVHETSGTGYVVRSRDAHAWCLVWRNGTWQDFDPTPASWMEKERNKASVFQSISDGWQWLMFQLAKFRWGHANLQSYLLLTTVPITVFLLYQIIVRRNWRLHRRRNPGHAGPVWPGLDSEFYELESQLARRGLPRLPNEPLAAWIERTLRQLPLPDGQDALRSLLRLHYRYRFDPNGLGMAEREQLRQGVRGCLASLARAGT